MLFKERKKVVFISSFTKRSFWKLTPLLLLYLAIILLFTYFLREKFNINWGSYFGDERRYLAYADNLMKGYFASEETNYLWSGPGYPLFLTVFRGLKIPLLIAKLSNAFLLFGGICFVFFTLKACMCEKNAMKGAYCLGLYPPFWVELSPLLTESLTIFLVGGGIYFLTRFLRHKKWHSLLGAALFWAYLALTKIIFGYVIVAVLIVSSILGIYNRAGRRVAYIFGIAILLCTPYLFYTYSLTGKIFYWGNAGGQALYWMTSPYPEEYGDWRSTHNALRREEYARHHKFITSLQDLDFVERDERYKQRAFQNIKEKPLKYIYNWTLNCSRLWFNYPFSYKQQTPYTLFYMIPNAFILVTTLYCLYPLWKRRTIVRSEIWFLLFIAIVYLGLSSIVGAGARYLMPVVPIFLVLIFSAFSLRSS